MQFIGATGNQKLDLLRGKVLRQILTKLHQHLIPAPITLGNDNRLKKANDPACPGMGGAMALPCLSMGGAPPTPGQGRAIAPPILRYIKPILLEQSWIACFVLF